MKYLLDTCVVSEPTKRVPSEILKSWLAGVDVADLYVSVVTIGELRSGARAAGNADLRRKLEVWIAEEVISKFCGRILNFDVETANQWGCLMGDGMAKGRKPSVPDSMIAATALAHGMAMVTRNVDDFKFDGLTVINPFEKEVAG